MRSRAGTMIHPCGRAAHQVDYCPTQATSERRRDNKQWTVREHQDQMLVARELEKILQAKKRRKDSKP